MNPTHTIYGDAWTETARDTINLDSGKIRVIVGLERPAKRGAKRVYAQVVQTVGAESAQFFAIARNARKEWIPALSL